MRTLLTKWKLRRAKKKLYDAGYCTEHYLKRYMTRSDGRGWSSTLCPLCAKKRDSDRIQREEDLKHEVKILSHKVRQCRP